MYRITSRYNIAASLHLVVLNVLLTRQMLKPSLGASLIVIPCAYFVENFNDSTCIIVATWYIVQVVMAIQNGDF